MMFNQNKQHEANTYGWIDSMSITQMVQAFEVWPKNSFPFGWHVPRSVTALLICTDNIMLAPGISSGKTISNGSIGLVTRELIRAGVVVRPEITDSLRKSTLSNTKRYIRKYHDRVKDQYGRLLERHSGQVQGWMEWSIYAAWVEHAQNFGSLIDLEFVPQLAQILNVSEEELSQLTKLTSSLDTVRSLAKKQPDTDAFNMTYKCFLLGALFRGIYHDYLARHSGHQVAHHPLREALLPKLTATSLQFRETNVETYLTNIVLRSALSEKKLESRLIRWAENLRRIRDANKEGYEIIDLRPKDDPKLAKKEAIRAAKTIGIDVHAQWLEELADGILALGVIGVGILLNPFVGAGLGGTHYFVSRRTDLGRQLVRGLYDRDSRLSRLAESPPGRISHHMVNNTDLACSPLMVLSIIIATCSIVFLCATSYLSHNAQVQ